MYNNGPTGAVQIAVKRLLIQETGTYNAMYARPYEIDVSSGQLDSVINRVNRHVGPMTSELFSGVASAMIHPTAVVGQANLAHIPQGWDRQRLRWVMEVEVVSRMGSNNIYYLQGFTDHMGARSLISNVSSSTDFLDPNMVFFVNSFIRMHRGQIETAFGMQPHEVIVESAQVLNGQLVYDGTNEVHRMRPTDIYAGMQSNFLRESGGGIVYDSRTTTSKGVDSFGSSRSNALPGRYLANVMNEYNSAQEMAHYGQDSSSVMARAQSALASKEPEPGENAVLRALAQIQGVRETVSFRLGDLQRLSPHLANVTKLVQNTPAQKAALHQAGTTAYWNDNTRETVFATQLSLAVPALMMENFMSVFHFTATNHSSDQFGKTLLIPTHQWSLVGADMSRYIGRLIDRIRDEILFDLSFRNEDRYHITMQVDLYGETSVTVQLRGPAIRYSVPSFGDGLISPVYTRDPNQFQGLISSVELVNNQMNRAAGTSGISLHAGI